MKILGISAFYHDSAAALLVDGKLIAAAQEERFSRIKHDAAFPVQAIRYCLAEGNCTIDELDAIAFYEKPWLKFERLLESYYYFAPKGLRSFITALPGWINEKLFFKQLIKKELEKVEPYASKKLNLLFPEHHLSHAASAFYPSPFEEAAILTIDGVGEWATTAMFSGNQNSITQLKQSKFPHSVGLLYAAFTYFLGFSVNNGEYKLMGLAPYGNPESQETRHFIQTIYDKLIKVYEDGSVWLNQSYFTYVSSLRMVNDQKWAQLFGIKKRQADTEINQQHCNLAYAIQHITEEIVLKLARHLKAISSSENLCLAGGVALNCVANGKLHRAGIFKHIFVQAAAGDAGGAIGAAFAAHHAYFGQNRILSNTFDPFLGPSFSRGEIEAMILKQKAVARKTTNEEIASLLAAGNIIGRFAGRMEMGPRALGNRSILADPRVPDMQYRLNMKIKFRESFRPFAPAILKEKALSYFESCEHSPYMLFTFPLAQSLRKSIPADYYALPPKEKLAHKRTDLQAITHVDFSARVQTVDKQLNPGFYRLLKAFDELTGCPVLINTSFNVRGEPIVCSPEDACLCFMKSGLDYLVIEDYLIAHKSQGTFVSD